YDDKEPDSPGWMHCQPAESVNKSILVSHRKHLRDPNCQQQRSETDPKISGPDRQFDHAESGLDADRAEGPRQPMRSGRLRNRNSHAKIEPDAVTQEEPAYASAKANQQGDRPAPTHPQKKQ